MSDIIQRFIQSKYFRNVVFTKMGATAIKLLGIYILYRVLNYGIQKIFFGIKRVDHKVRDTMAGLASTIAKIVFILMGLFTLLDSVGINTSSLVATAGVGGVAIGFGAQSLVKDVIAGFFILTEGQYFVGDDVVIEGVSGVVTDFGIRSTWLRDYDLGAVHIIPNGSITHVENRSMTQQQSRINIDVPEKYPIAKLYQDMLEIIEEFGSDERIIEEPELRGLYDAPERYNRIQIYTEVEKETVYQFSRDMRSFLLQGLESRGYVLTSPMIINGTEEE